MDEIKLNLENLTEEERIQLMKLVEKGNKARSKKWKPSGDERYYCVGTFGNITHPVCEEDEGDNFCFLMGNCFRTKEEAEEHKKELEIKARWKQLSEESGEPDNPWDGEHRHWHIWYSLTLGGVHTTCAMEVRNHRTYFASEEALLSAIEEFGEENVKKYILGVKE